MTGSTFRVQVRLFGLHREAAGTSLLEVDLESGATVGDLRSIVAGQQVVDIPISGVAVAVNRAYASDDQALQEGDEVAIIPPVAGG